jgi:cytochrome c553
MTVKEPFKKLIFPHWPGKAKRTSPKRFKITNRVSRHNDLYGRMRSIAKEMTDAEIKALAHYYAGFGD